MSENRMPTQKRSIEKKNKIIEKGFELMCEKGFHNVSTPDIAKAAEVSTGIIYQYFNDKKEIFIEGVKNYSQTILFPMIDLINSNSQLSIDNLDNILNNLIDSFIKSHTISQKAHEELMAMTHLDKDISDILNNAEIEVTEKLKEYLELNNIYIENSSEKLHLIFGVVENLCHEIIYHKHNKLDYDIMKKEVIKIIKTILKD